MKQVCLTRYDGLDAGEMVSGIEHRDFDRSVFRGRQTDSGLAFLVDALPHLRTLDLRDTDITVEGLVTLVPQLPEIRVLGVSGNLLDAEVADHLKRNTGIGELHISPPIEGDGWIEAVDIIGAAKLNGKPV